MGGAGRFGRASETARLPAEAKHLASLPVAKAIATRLDARAAKERDRARQADSAQAALPGPVTARWAWAPAATVALPALGAQRELDAPVVAPPVLASILTSIGGTRRKRPSYGPASSARPARRG
jgi:hypothetical protein